MGCDIHSFAEVRRNGVWEISTEEIFPYDDSDKERFGKECSKTPLRNRHYRLFGWIAGVRNYSVSPTICEPKGIPEDASKEVFKAFFEWEPDGHSHSWLTLQELLAVDYDEKFEDRRTTKVVKNITYGAALADVGEGRIVTLREHLGSEFFRTLEALKTLGNPEDVRIVFWFDN